VESGAYTLMGKGVCASIISHQPGSAVREITINYKVKKVSSDVFWGSLGQALKVYCMTVYIALNMRFRAYNYFVKNKNYGIVKVPAAFLAERCVFGIKE